MEEEIKNPWNKHTEEEAKLNPTLFDKDEYNKWEEEWKNMPEFIQVKQKPYTEIIIRFACEEDLRQFSILIGQNLNKTSNSTWYPAITRGINSYSLENSRKYIDEP